MTSYPKSQVTPVPKGAWMRKRATCGYMYARNKSPIVWTKNEPRKHTEVHCIVIGTMHQCEWMSCRTYIV